MHARMCHACANKQLTLLLLRSSNAGCCNHQETADPSLSNSKQDTPMHAQTRHNPRAAPSKAGCADPHSNQRLSKLQDCPQLHRAALQFLLLTQAGVPVRAPMF